MKYSHIRFLPIALSIASLCACGNNISTSRAPIERPYTISYDKNGTPNFFEIDLLYSKPESTENEKFRNISIGDTYYLGSYEADAITDDGAESIEWIVLSKTADTLVLITERTLDVRPYDTMTAKPTWYDSTLRKYLNEDLYNAIFTEEEKKSIVMDASSDYITIPDEDTITSLLPTEEERRCLPTPYSRNQGSIATYWLKDINKDYSVKYVNYDGRIISEGTNPSDSTVSIRPMITITE